MLYEHRKCPSILAGIVDGQTPGKHHTTRSVPFFCGQNWWLYIQVIRPFCLVPWGGPCHEKMHTATDMAIGSEDLKWPDGTAPVSLAVETSKTLMRTLQQRVSRLLTFNSVMPDCVDAALLAKAAFWCEQANVTHILTELDAILAVRTPGTFETPHHLVDTCIFHTLGDLVLPFLLAMHTLPLLAKLPISGLCGVSQAIIVWQPATQEYVVHTSGSNFRALVEGVLLTKSLSFIDIQRSCTSNIPDILQVLGVEAVHRMHSTATIAGVNRSCIQSIVDHFLRDGYISLQRNNSVLNEITVENPQRHMIDAAIHGTVDTLTGISASVLCGTAIHSGTHGHQILFDLSTMM
jgi:hypothetical protein